MAGAAQLGAAVLTINVPVVCTARNVMVLRRARSITRGHWKGWALEIQTFLGPEMATSEASAIWALRYIKSAPYQSTVHLPFPLVWATHQGG
jgi:hypothetical protein